MARTFSASRNSGLLCHVINLQVIVRSTNSGLKSSRRTLAVRRLEEENYMSTPYTTC